MNNKENCPNIIMIVADDLGCCDMGCYGNTRAITPYLDEFARCGTKFTRHYSASPMCAPARASLLTGKYPHRTGAIDVCSIRGLNRVSHEEVTLPQLLKQKGYRTGLIGKWHNGGGSSYFHPSQYGYDTFCGFEGGGSPYFDYYLEKSFGELEHVTGHYITDRLTDEAIQFVEENKSMPFFMQLAYNAPHRPLEAPEEDISLFDNYDDMTKGLKILYAMVTRMDRNIGRLMEVLIKNNLMENTLILFISDNGPDGIGSGNMSTKRNLYHSFHGHKGDTLEGGIRVPALLRWDGHLPAGNNCDEIFSFIDWLPTFAELLNITIPETADIDGHNVWPIILGTQHNSSDYFWHWTRYEIIKESNAAVIHKGYKLYYPAYKDTTKYYDPDSRYNGMKGTYNIITDPIKREHPNGNNTPLLFYLPQDQKESKNISDLYPQITDKLKNMLDGWLVKMIQDYNNAKKDTLTKKQLEE